jgi:hypothetical protein
MKQKNYWLPLILLFVATVCGATTIQIKRGNDANLPTTLKMGEIAMTRDTHRTFVGYSTGKVELQPILGNYSCAGASYMKEYDSATGQWVCSTPEGSGGGGGDITGVTAGTGLAGGGTSGDVTVSMADMAANTLKGNNTGAGAVPADLTVSQVKTLLSYTPADIGAQSALTGVGTVELNGTDTGNRTTAWDWHSSDGVDYNTRMSKASGLNSQFTINNRGISGTENGSVVIDATAVSVTGSIAASGSISANPGGGAAIVDAANFGGVGNAGTGRGFGAVWKVPTGGSNSEGGRINVAETAASDDNTYMDFFTRDSDVSTKHMRISTTGVDVTGALTTTGAINKVTITAPATAATLTLADGSTLATSGANSLTLTTTGATNVTLPTSGELATTAQIVGLTGSTTVDALSVAANLQGQIGSVTVTGAAVGDFVDVSCSDAGVSANLILRGHVSATNTVEIYGFRPAASNYDPASATYYVKVVAHP